MQEQHPHEIRRFADGETMPDGWVELTEEQFAELDPMTPEERGEWLEKHGTRDPFAAFKEELAPLTKGDPDEITLFVSEARKALKREQREHHPRQRMPQPQQPTPPRQHRRQTR